MSHNNKAKASQAAGAQKSEYVPPGKSFDNFCKACGINKEDESTTENPVKEQIKKWLEKFKEQCEERKTQTGEKHKVVISHSKQFLDDLRVVIPKSKEGGKGQDGQGLRNQLKDKGFDQERLTLTWAVCYANDIHVPTDKLGWEKFECSHTCCEYDENGKRIENARCIDPACLTWESKSTNQERANKACRMMCHCGCGKTICEANGIHKPCCR